MALRQRDVMRQRGTNNDGNPRAVLARAVMEALEGRQLLAQSVWAFPGADGKLLYRPMPFGDKIGDYSSVGYRGGTVPIPHVVTKVTLTEALGDTTDDTARIQAAIDSVEAMTPDAAGFRGAVFLSEGEYEIATSVTINTSGVVLRGAGQGKTILVATGLEKDTVIRLDGNGGRSLTGTAVAISDKYVPLGAISFTVDSVSQFAVGDSVMIERKATSTWLHDIGMDRLDNPWTGRDVDMDRVITRIDGNVITLDAPLTHALDKVRPYGGGTIQKYTATGRLANVGVESISGRSTFDASELSGSDRIDEDHAEHFIGVDGVINGWVRNVTSEYFGYSCVNMTGPSKWVTVQDSQCLDPVSVVTGGRRYSFNMGDSTSVLWKNLYTRHGRHDYVQGSEVTGPNVVVDSRADNARADTGPHHRYSTGTLWDNLDVNGNGLNIQNRWNSGSGHGWAGANQVVWNSDASSFIIQNIGQPYVSAVNWAIGNTGTVNAGNLVGPGPGPVGTQGIYDSHGTKVDTRSLYHAQLGERMAHENFALREVRMGDADDFVNDGAIDNVFVDGTWRTNIQAATGQTGVGFDNVAANHLVPFTFNFSLDPGTYVVGAQLALGVKSGSGGGTGGDRIFIEHAGRFYTWADFGVSAPGANGQGAIIDLSTLLPALQDGRLNLAIAGNAAVDWATLNFQTASTTQPTTTKLTASADATVRGGASAGSNFGTASALDTKLEALADNVRESYLKFNLAGLLNQPLVSAYVRLVPTSVGVHSTTFGSHIGAMFNQLSFVGNDAWTETGINFTNKPVSDPFFREFMSYPNEPVTIDVTSLVRGALAGDKTLSLRLASVVESTTGQIGFASRENSNVGFRPQLVIQTYNAITPVADATVRSGTSANSNLGTQPGLGVGRDPTSPNDTLESYLKFDLTGVATAPAGATVRLFPTLIGTSLVQSVGFVGTDTWTETGITYNTKPASGSAIATWRGNQSVPPKFDVTSLVSGAVGGADKLLSFRLFGTAANGLNQYAAREYADASLVPLLVLKNLGPQITAIPRVVGALDSSTGPHWFGVWDAETLPGSLTVSAVSSNTTLLPNANITFGGSGADRTFTLTPAAGQSGVANVTITVTDAQGLSAQTTFQYFVENTIPINGDQAGPNQDDVFKVVRSGSFLDIFRNDMVTPIVHVDYATAATYAINGLGGNDQVLIDLSGGNPIPAAGLSIDGGFGTDFVSVLGASAADAVSLADGNIIVGGNAAEVLATSEELRLTLGAGGDTLTAGGNASVLPGAVLLTVIGGTLSMGAGSVLPDVTDVTVNAGATLNLNGQSQTIDALSGGGIVKNDTGTATLTVGQGGSSSSFTGTLQNGAATWGLTKAGAGTLTLSGDNRGFTGVVTINAGAIASGNENSLANTGSFVMFNGGTFRVTANTNSINLTNKYSTNHSFAGTTATFNVDTGVTLTVGVAGGGGSMRTAGGSFAGGSFIKTGLGTLRVVTNNGQLDDPFLLNQGTVVLESATGLGGADNSANHVDMKAGTTLVLRQNTPTDFLTPINVVDSGGVVNVVVDRQSAGAGVNHALNTATGVSSFTLNVAAGANVTSGVAGLTFDSLVTNNPVTFTVGANANVSIPGVVSGTSGLTKNGVGMLTLTGANTYAGPTLVNAGALDVSPSAIPASNAVTVNNTGTYRMNGGSGALFDIGSLTVNGGGAARINTPAGANAILAVDALSVLSNGLLHITDADLLWDYSGGTPYTTTKNLVALGSSTGTQGIVTSGAADQIYAVIDNAAGFGASDWRGIAVDGTTVICKLTYYGDGNLDGQVTTDDYVVIDLNLGHTPAQWFHGDFDESGTVTTDDYVVVDLNLGSGTTSSASSSELFADDPEAVLALAEPPVVSKPPKVRKAGSRR